jgi:antitoxin VapB
MYDLYIQEWIVKTTRTFKSGNSVAVRLPKALGVGAGIEMRVREEKGHYVLELVASAKRIDLTGVYGSCPGLKPLGRKDRIMEPRELDWEGKLLSRD